MWNPLTPAQVVAAMGVTARDAARSEQTLDDWERGQLLSVYSATRHLAAEIGEVEPLVGAVTADLAAALRTCPEEHTSSAPLTALATKLDDTLDPRAAADLACQALDILRNDPSAASAGVRGAVRKALRRAVELEVQILADAIEGPARR